MTTYEFDVARSYAGEDRSYVEVVASHLKQHGVRVFYDQFEVAEMWGVDLYSYLDDVYRKKSRYAVVFASRFYAKKMWTSHEQKSAQARALQEKQAYLLPVRLDDSEVPGLRPTVAYLDGSTIGPTKVAEMLVSKLQTQPGPPNTQSDTSAGDHAPLTLDESRALVAIRPPAWEYLLLAGSMWQYIQALDEKYRDHKLRFARVTGEHIPKLGRLQMVGSTASRITPHSTVVDQRSGS